MKIVAPVCLFLLVVVPPIPGQTTDKTAHESEKPKNYSSGNQQAPPQVGAPVVVNSDAAPDAKKEGAEKKKGDSPVTISTAQPLDIHADVSKDWMDRIAWGLNCVLVAVAVFGVLYARSTLRAIKAQLTEMQAAGKQTDRMIEHVGTQAQAAKLQAEHMASSERPWVLVEKFGEPLFSDGLERPEMFASMAGTPQAVVDFKLAGSTVARIIGVDVRFHLVPQKGELLQPDLPDEPVYIESSSTNRSPDSAFVKAPGQIVSLPIRLESGYVTAEQLTSISQGALYPCVYGRIRYLDSFVSTPHETRFCFIYRLSYGRTFYSNATGKQSIPNRFHEGDGPSVYTRYT